MVSRQLLVGEFVSGAITGQVEPLDYSWSDVFNDSGTITAAIPGSEVRRLNLRSAAAAQRCFLAVVEEGRYRQAGPVRGYKWDWKSQTLELTAGDLWSWFDQRQVGDPAQDHTPRQTQVFRLSGADVPELMAQLCYVTLANTYAPYSMIPGSFSYPGSGPTSRSFYGYALEWVGTTLRDMTKEGYDVRIRPDDGQNIGLTYPSVLWRIDIGSTAQPQLSQTGDDWVFDATAPKSPVRGVTVDGDGSKIAVQGYISGSGSETNTVMDYLFTPAGQALLDAGYPLLDLDASLPQEQDIAVLDTYLRNLLDRSARPVEAWKVDVDTAAALEVRPGDYCRLILADDPYLGDVNARCRVSKLSGSYRNDFTTLELFPVSAAL